MGEFNNYLNLETAEGEWLDIIGKLIWLNRNLNIGYDLSDESYKDLIKLK